MFDFEYVVGLWRDAREQGLSRTCAYNRHRLLPASQRHALLQHCTIRPVQLPEKLPVQMQRELHDLPVKLPMQIWRDYTMSVLVCRRRAPASLRQQARGPPHVHIPIIEPTAADYSAGYNH